jgi:peptide/nickel transport system permease protein
MQEIKKQLPFYKATVIRIAENRQVEKVGPLTKIYKGQEPMHKSYAVSSYWFSADSVFFRLYSTGAENIRRDTLRSRYARGSDRLKAFSLVDATRAVYPLPSDKLGTLSTSNIEVNGDEVRYLDMEQKVKQEHLSKLKAEFEKNNIENRTFILGTDRDGRDILSRLMYGTRTALAIGFVSVFISLVLGIMLGALGGFFGGRTDSFIMWLMTVIWSIPSIMMVIVIRIALDSKGLWVVFVAVGLTMWVDIARVVRGEIKSIKEKLFVEAARAFGLSDMRIIVRHIIPNAMGTITVLASSNFASAILLEAGLSFLGLGVQPPTPSWGWMINDGFNAITSPNSWHLIIMPSLCISLLVLAFNLLGNGLRDAFDPKTLYHHQ